MMSVTERRQWAMFVHLAGFSYYLLPALGGVLGPLLLWQLRKDDDFVADQGKEAVNFQLTFLLLEIISVVLCFVFIGFFLLLGLQVFRVVVMIVAAMKANDGVPFRYPLAIRFIS
jgi:uncharacterized Tic20 family protein